MDKACICMWRATRTLHFVWTTLIYTNSHIVLADYAHAFGRPNGQYVSFNRAGNLIATFLPVFFVTLLTPDNDQQTAGFLFTPQTVSTQQSLSWHLTGKMFFFLKVRVAYELQYEDLFTGVSLSDGRRRRFLWFNNNNYHFGGKRIHSLSVSG